MKEKVKWTVVLARDTGKPIENETWHTAADFTAARYDLQKWIREHMPEFGDMPYWRHIASPNRTLIDFGSHTHYGLIVRGGGRGMTSKEMLDKLSELAAKDPRAYERMTAILKEKPTKKRMPEDLAVGSLLKGLSVGINLGLMAIGGKRESAAALARKAESVAMVLLTYAQEDIQ